MGQNMQDGSTLTLTGALDHFRSLVDHAGHLRLEAQAIADRFSSPPPEDRGEAGVAVPGNIVDDAYGLASALQEELGRLSIALGRIVRALG